MRLREIRLVDVPAPLQRAQPRLTLATHLQSFAVHLAYGLGIAVTTETLYWLGRNGAEGDSRCHAAPGKLGRRPLKNLHEKGTRSKT